MWGASLLLFIAECSRRQKGLQKTVGFCNSLI